MADNVEIQGLEFQIQENSNGAVQGLTALTTTLERLKTATGGGVRGLSTTAKQLTALNTALNGLRNAYYAAGNSTIKKVNGSANAWWERSPHGSNTGNFCGVGSNGYAYNNAASHTTGVSFGFCV